MKGEHDGKLMRECEGTNKAPTTKKTNPNHKPRMGLYTSWN